MKKLLHIGIFLFFSIDTMASENQPVLVDTVDFWQLKIKGKELPAIYSPNSFSRSPCEAIYFLDNVSEMDTLSILYFTDTPCSDCLSKIELRDRNDKVIKLIEKNFDNTPFLMAGEDIRKILGDNNNEVYIYFTGRHKDWRPWRLLGLVTVK